MPQTHHVHFTFPHPCLYCALECLFLHCPLGKHSSFKPAQAALLGEDPPDVPSHNVDRSLPWPLLPSQHLSPEPCTWFTCWVPVESLQGGGGPESPQCLPSLLPTLSLRLAPPGQELSQGSSYLGEDLFHVSGSWLQSPGPGWVQRTQRRFPACHQGQPGGGMTAGLAWPHPPCGQAPPRLPPMLRKGQQGPAPAWPFPTLRSDRDTPRLEFSSPCYRRRV